MSSAREAAGLGEVRLSLDGEGGRAVGKGGQRQKLSPLIDWQYDINEAARRSAKIAWAVAVAALVVALAAVGGVAALAPLKTVEPVFVRVDSATGAIDVLHRIDEVQGLDKDEALAKGYLARYVYAREGYFRPTVQEAFRRVSRMTVGPELARYRAEMAADHPNAPVNVHGDQERVEIRLKSIAFLERGLAQVRFIRVVTGNDGDSRDERRTHHVATVRYGYEPNAEIPLSALADNALGFAVREYGVAQEDAE
jgi:type IV secretion system protein VirB8